MERTKMEMDFSTSNGKLAVANIVAEAVPGDISSVTESQTIDCNASYCFNQLQHESYFKHEHLQQMID